MLQEGSVMSNFDPRWVVLTEDGSIATLGRHREPNADDLAEMEIALAQVGRAGWIAIMSHSAYSTQSPDLIMVRPVRHPRVPFDAAVEAFRRQRGG